MKSFLRSCFFAIFAGVRVFYRSIFVFLTLIGGLLMVGLVFPWPGSPRAAITRVWARAILWSCGVRVELFFHPDFFKDAEDAVGGGEGNQNADSFAALLPSQIDDAGSGIAIFNSENLQSRSVSRSGVESGAAHYGENNVTGLGLSKVDGFKIEKFNSDSFFVGGGSSVERHGERKNAGVDQQPTVKNKIAAKMQRSKSVEFVQADLVGEAIEQILPSGALFLSNHPSWVDTPLLQSIVSTGFVAKSELRYWPVIGWLIRKTGCVIFIERLDPRALAKISRNIAKVLEEGSRVVIFPSGRRDRGVLLPFHSALTDAAVRAKVPVFPVAIRYMSSQGVPVGSMDRSNFIFSVLNLLRSDATVAHVFFLPCAKGTDRHQLTESAFLSISDCLSGSETYPLKEQSVHH